MFAGADADRDIWLIDAQRGVRTRITSGAADDNNPLPSADGSRVVFSSRRGAVKKLQMIAANGTAGATTLVEDPFDKFALSWSPDGRMLMYERFGGPTGFDLWMLPMAGGKPQTFIQTAAVEANGEFSPDGRYVAYQSLESGRFEVYVTNYPDRSRTWPVSTAGGAAPHWRRDGKEMFFVAGAALMHAPVTTTAAGIEIGAAAPLIDLSSRFPKLTVQFDTAANIYDVAPDGQRFLFNLPLQNAPDPLTLIVNWPQLAAASGR
jgi:Tol biopolymer transport system component